MRTSWGLALPSFYAPRPLLFAPSSGLIAPVTPMRPRSPPMAVRLLLALLATALLAPAGRAAAPPPPDKRAADKTIREVAGSAEYLRSVPKHFATLQGVDASRRTVTLL